jgi:hypothetical protein
MSTPERPALAPRWIRTLPWLGGLLLGTAAHLVWWTTEREPERVIEVVTVPASSPNVHVHVHPEKRDGAGHVRRPGERLISAQQAAEASCHRKARQAHRRALHGTRGAVVCSGHGCTIRRSFVERMLRDPSLLGPAARVQSVQGPAGTQGLQVLGVYPGSVPDLLGLRSGDVITEIDGMTMQAPSDLRRLGQSLEGHSGISLTLQRGELRQTLRYRVIEG